jgi:hypothetical protein
MALFFGFFAELFSFILSFLLVFAIFYGTLSKTKALTDNAAVNSLIAFVIAILFAVSGAVMYMLIVIPYFAILIVLFAAFFLLLFLLGFKMETLFSKENEKTTKFVIWTVVIISIAFLFFVGWKLYYDDVKAQLDLYALKNATITNPDFIAQLNGNPFHDIPLRYEYFCTLQGRYLSPVSFFGTGGILCLVMHPRIIGVVLLLPILALIVYIVSHSNMPKEQKK